ncbi:hypothetical protein ACFXAW_14425 [Streptomyces sp. NPDC059445]|uniref:hypothetical protein n=1 Tax=Streptomyces sp. NPDC059445 TaxID=3346832 RepID=UPI0036CB8C62
MSENPTENPTEFPAEARAEGATGNPAQGVSETPAETSVEAQAEAPAEASAEAPVTSAETPAETSTETPAETSVEASAETPAEAPAPGSDPAQGVAESSGEAVDVAVGEVVAPRKRLRARRVVAVSGAVLLVAAVVGGVGWTSATVNAADRDPGAPTWRFPKPAKAKDQEAKSAKGLAGMLLPFDKAYTPGPDLGEFGNDAELNGRQATALRKESLRDLPRTQRRRLEKEIDEEHIKGVVMRSYASADSYAVYKKQTFTASITLSQMENQRTVREISKSHNALLESLGIFRKGPKIEGHKNAGCFLPPKDKTEKLDMMFCSAYVGDVLVSATVSGIKPLDGPTVTRFLAAQLDRITDPGEAV